MAAVRQLAGERKGLGSGAQSARQANSLLANLQAAGVDRAALAAAAAAAAAAIRVVGAPSPPLSLSGLALRGEAAAAGADGAMGGRLEAGALHAVVLALVVAALARCGGGGGLSRISKKTGRARRRGQNQPSELLLALFPPLKAPQRDVRAAPPPFALATAPPPLTDSPPARKSAYVLSTLYLSS